MDREHFLIELKLHLRQLPIADQQAIITKYNTLFDEHIASGLSEYEITKELEHPKDIAKKILADFGIAFTETNTHSHEWMEFSSDNKADHPYDMDQGFHDYSHDSTFIRFFQIAGVLALNFLFMIWMIFSWLAILVGGWIVTLSFIFSPLLGLFSILNVASSYSLFQFFVSIILSGLGLIGYLIMIPLSRGSFKLLKLYTAWNIRVLKGDKRR